ncbi:MAG: 2-hydroxychromene-2-carboxylate isomerase [Thalassovita sp.]
MADQLPKIGFWFEFASTYSYLSAMRIQRMATTAGIGVAWHPFLLGPIFAAQGWNDSPFNIYPAKGRYMWRDLARRASQQGLPPIQRPAHFPQNGLLAARIATIGASQMWGPDFVRGVFAAQFAKGADIGEPDVLTSVLNDIGQPLSLLDQARSDPSIKDQLRQTTDQAQTLGLFGAPSFTTQDKELFWGDDRLEDALAWAKR